MGWVSGETERRARHTYLAYLEERSEFERKSCEICNGVVYLCPICRVPIEGHSHENDFICKTHSFVNPIREHDGARINGDGVCGAPLRTWAVQ
jgi:hypothetical protein